MTGERIWRGLAALAAGAGVWAILSSAAAEPSQQAHREISEQAGPFGALLGRRGPRDEREDREREVERYVVSADGRVFLFAHEGAHGRIKFLCHEGDARLDCRVDPSGPAEEIFKVTADRGPRGDLIFKNREGEPLLRLAPYGGATVFWPGDPYGQAASKSFGEDEGALDLPEETRADARARAQAAAANLSALTGSPIVFDIGPYRAAAEILTDAGAAAAPETPEAAEDAEEAAEPDRARGFRDASVLADAVARAAAGLYSVASDPTGARVLGARIAEVRFVPGPAPSLALEDKILTVTYNPQGGLDGRPSSSAISRYLEDNL